jgi:hypothetical protein
MKSILTSVATAVALCIFVLVQNGFGQANWSCEYTLLGCSLEFCVPQDGNCPLDIVQNAGAAYSFVDTAPVSVYSCSPIPGTGCNQNAFNEPFCSLIAYQGPNVGGVCDNDLCGWSETVNQCAQ